MRLLGYFSIVSIGLLVSLTILACGEATAPAPVVFSYTCDPSAGPDLNETQQALLDSEPHRGMRTSDDEWADIARQVPGGFGGFFVADGASAMYLKEPERKDDALAALEDLGVFGRFAAPPLLVERGLWSFDELYDWKRYIVLHGDWPDGLISATIDVNLNRLVYGVLEEKGQRVADYFTSLHLPCDLLLLEVGTIVVAAREAGFGEP